MANRLKPRRGKKSTATNQKIMLEKGEVFFECPDDGVGKGQGRIMIGDGSTTYDQLVSSNKYFYNPDNFLNTNSDVSHNPVNFIDDTCDDCQTLLEHITTGKNVGSLFGSVHKLLSKHDTSINQLNNDLSNKVDKDKYFVSEEFEFIDMYLHESNTIDTRDLRINDIINPITTNTIFYLQIVCDGYIFFEELYILYDDIFYKICNICDQRDRDENYQCDITIDWNGIIIKFNKFNNTMRYRLSITVRHNVVNLK